MKKHIFFVGGGTIGHIAPSLAVWEAIEKEHPHHYVPLFLCADRKDETQYLQKNNLPYSSLSLPKPNLLIFLPWRFFQWLVALVRCAILFQTKKPVAVFSKGGYVSVLPCFVAWILRIPIILHESDAVFGNANRFLARFCKYVCCGFFSAVREIPGAIHTGNPIRRSVGNREMGRKVTGLNSGKPILVVIGGSQGSVAINEAISQNLSSLLGLVDIVHITGRGKSGASLRPGYFVAEFVLEDMPSILALGDIFLSRAGAGMLSELSVLGKPMIIIPLEGVAHNHQCANAKELEQQNAAIILTQKDIHQLVDRVETLLSNKKTSDALGKNIATVFPQNAAEKIANIILSVDSSVLR